MYICEFAAIVCSGLAEQFGFSSGPMEDEPEENMGLADKFQLVKQVAQKVQVSISHPLSLLCTVSCLLACTSCVTLSLLHTVSCLLVCALCVTLSLSSPYCVLPAGVCFLCHPLSSLYCVLPVGVGFVCHPLSLFSILCLACWCVTLSLFSILCLAC